MPFATIRTVKGALNAEEKKKLQGLITDALVEVEGGGNPDFRQHVWVLIEETEGENWSVGGINPTAEMIIAMRENAKT